MCSYEWKGVMEEDTESMMIIKTRSSIVGALTQHVRAAHPYENAEVIALPVRHD